MRLLLVALLAAISYAQTDCHLDPSNEGCSDCFENPHGDCPGQCDRYREYWCPVNKMRIRTNWCIGKWNERDPCEEERDRASCCVDCSVDPKPEVCPSKCETGFNIDWCSKFEAGDMTVHLSQGYCRGPTCVEEDSEECCNLCCSSDHVECIACRNSRSIAEQCAADPTTIGCNEEEYSTTVPLGCRTEYGLHSSDVSHGSGVGYACDGNTFTRAQYKTNNCEVGTEEKRLDGITNYVDTWENIDECTALSNWIGHGEETTEIQVTCADEVATFTLCDTTANNCQIDQDDGQEFYGCLPNMCKDLCCGGEQATEAYLHEYHTKMLMKARCYCGTESDLRFGLLKEDAENAFFSTLDTCVDNNAAGDGNGGNEAGDGGNEGNSNSLSFGIGILSAIIFTRF